MTVVQAASSTTASVTKVFTVNAQTKVSKGKLPITLADLKVGAAVGVSFYTQGTQLVATRIAVIPPQMVAKFEDPVKREAVCLRGTNVFGASLNRFDKIIAKMEAQIATDKAAGKDTTKAETDLAEAKKDLADARTLVGTGESFKY
jgi:hypothetical protein